MNFTTTTNESLKKAIEAIKKLNEINQGDAYLVGGCVRDMVIGIEPNDYDIVTNIPMDVIEQNFKVADIGQSRDFGILCVIIDDEPYEVAQLRIDGDSSDNRHPDSVELGGVTLREDANRRDFTMNAMYMDVNGQVIDFHDGILDTNIGDIRFVGDPLKRLEEDALRLIRALRFSATKDMDITYETHEAICEFMIDSSKIESISIERFTQELVKVSKSGGIAMERYINFLDEYGLLEIFIPEIKLFEYAYHHHIHHPEGSLMKTKCQWSSGDDLVLLETDVDKIKNQPEIYEVVQNGTVMDHVLACLRVMPLDSTSMEVLGVLFHDIGKPASADIHKDSTETLIAHSFHGHECVGVGVFETIAKRLKFSNDMIKEISFSVRHHLEFFRLMEMKKSKVVELALSPYFETMKTVCFADDQSRGSVVSRIDKFHETLAYVDELVSGYEDVEKLKAKVADYVDGYKVINLRSDAEGVLIGKIIKHVKELLIESDFSLTMEQVDDVIVTYGVEA
jgi:tRNA nucleotidyltransferase/poly(A) polymerase